MLLMNHTVLSHVTFGVLLASSFQEVLRDDLFSDDLFLESSSRASWARPDLSQPASLSAVPTRTRRFVQED